MFRLIKKTFLTVLFVLLFAGFGFPLAGNIFAAPTDLSVRLEKPKSPTNQNNFNLVFVALDIQGRPVTVKCFKKSPSDGVFVQFGGDIVLDAGGNTGNCSVGSANLNSSGLYDFRVEAAAGSDTATSETYTVDFNIGGPGNPINFSKEKINSCQYKISYKTADDGGKTVKVELYRSENQTFTADSGTLVEFHGVGSNVSDSFTNSIPDCGKSYYYAIRAFDTYGNGSALIGDSSVVNIKSSTGSTTTLASSPVTGAIPVGAGGTGSQGQVLGEETKDEEIKKPDATPSGGVKAEETQEEVTPTPKPEGKILSTKNILIALGILIIAGVSYYFYNRSRKG